MIPGHAITSWGATHAWSSLAQVEQDLVLSRAMCLIAGDPHLGGELVFRGGTALHKLHLPRPRRYSEDLDYVRSTAGPIGRILDALREIGRGMGFKTASKMGEHPKVTWRSTTLSGLPLRVKIEINTHERSPDPGLCPAERLAGAGRESAPSWRGIGRGKVKRSRPGPGAER